MHFKWNNFLVFVIVIIFLLVLANVFQKETRGFFYWFSSPIQDYLWQAGDSTSDFFNGIFHYASLDNKLDELKQENQGLTAEIIQLKEVEEENETLRQALGIELQKEYNLSIAKIISKDLSEDYILINKGSKDNVKENAAVITENKVLVGLVKKVYGNYSKVMLPSNKEMSFDVKVQQEDKEVAAVARGQGNLRIALTLIPQQEEIFQGDTITTSYLGGVFPESLLVGTVRNVARNDIDPFQTAEIENALDISELKNVLIIND
jgi:rod shape-determining protein MreC